MKVLMFVEDPGALAFMEGLPLRWRERGDEVFLVADGVAAELLRCRGTPFFDPKAARDLLAKADVLVVGTSENEDSVGLKLIDEARSFGLASVGLVDGSANAQARFRGRGSSPRRHAPDYVLVPDEWTNSVYRNLDFQRVITCGHPRYDFVRTQALELSQRGRDCVRARVFPSAQNRRVLLFCAEVSSGLDAHQYRAGADYTLHGRGRSRDRTSIVVEELLDALREVQRQVFSVLRPHPKNTPEDLAELRAEFDQIESGSDPIAAVFGADVVVGMTTILLDEAALLGRATVSIVPRAREAEWLLSARLGATSVATTPTEIRRCLVRALDGELPERPFEAPPGALDRVVLAIDNAVAR